MPAHPFGLSENPFCDGHDPRYIYPASKRVEAVALLRRRLADGGSFVTITGEPGSGKTSVVTELLEDRTLNTRVAFIAHPSLTPSELLEAVCIEFSANVPSPPSKPQTLASLERHLRDLRALELTPVLVLDEAHGLKTELLEEARLLSNMKVGGRGLLQTILVGVPELERRLGLPELALLRQRVAAHVRVAPLTVEETEGYLRHRIGVAGGDGAALFPGETCRELFNYTNGNPRDLNTMAGRALECAEQAGAECVRVEDVRAAAGDARPPGIATASRSSSGTQPFALKRTVTVPSHARTSNPPVERAPAPPPPPRPMETAPVPPRPRPTESAPVPAPPPNEIRKPPSFLQAQQIARAGDAVVSAHLAPASGVAKPERALHRNDPAADARAGDDTRREQGVQGLLGEGARELGASVFLVATLVVALMATGRWNTAVLPPMQRSTEPSGSSQASGIAGVSPEPTGAVAVVREDPVTGPTVEPPDQTPLPEPNPVPPAIVTLPRNPAQDPILTPLDPSLGRVAGSLQGIGFEVASTSNPDTAAAALRKILKGSKLPCQIVTKSSGNRYRVVVGPFTTRREAEKAVSELFRHSLADRARVVQLVE